MNGKKLHKRGIGNDRHAIVKPVIVFTAAVAVIILAYTVFSAYLDKRPWIFGGSGTPDVILLNDGYRLEKVISLRKGYFIKDIRGGNMIYGRDGAGPGGEINGAADLRGNVVTALGEYDRDMFLGLDENGNVYVSGEPYGVSDKADKPVTAIDCSGKAALCFDVNGCRLVSYEGALGTLDDDGSVNSLFCDDTGKSRRLEYPHFFGEYAVVRIYYCDCVYRITRNDA